MGESIRMGNNDTSLRINMDKLYSVELDNRFLAQELQFRIDKSEEYNSNINSDLNKLNQSIKSRDTEINELNT